MRRDHHDDERETRHAQADQQTGRGTAQHERTECAAPSLLLISSLKRPIGEIQADHEQGEERYVLGVEEGMRVDARMQQEERQCEQRKSAAAEQSISKQVASEAASKEEQVCHQVAGEEHAVAVV